MNVDDNDDNDDEDNDYDDDDGNDDDDDVCNDDDDDAVHLMTIMLFADDAVATAADPQRDKCVLQKTFGCTKQPLSIKLPHPALSTPGHQSMRTRAQQTHAGTHTHTHIGTKNCMCIMYVAWPDKINAETVHKTFTFYYRPERETEKERGRERSTSRSRRY